MIIFNVLSLTGNIMVCIAVCKNTRLRTTTNLYIIALALSDLMSGVFLMPFSLGVLITGEWVYGRGSSDLIIAKKTIKSFMEAGAFMHQLN